MTATISAKDVAALRERTGAGMMDCKKALEESAGNLDKAVELLRSTGAAKAEKRAGRQVKEGMIANYIHHNGKIAVLVELNCETDFVARTDDFKEFALEVAQHIAAMGPDWVADEHVPEDFITREKSIFEQEAADKPENIRGNIVEGKLKKRLQDVVLMNQEHVNPKHEGRTIEQLRAEISQKTGENVVIRRFSRFQVGAE